jgi:hypothetical protein
VWKEDDTGLFGKVTGMVFDVTDGGGRTTVRLYTKGLIQSAASTATDIAHACSA